jgi:hypothetical protein
MGKHSRIGWVSWGGAGVLLLCVAGWWVVRSRPTPVVEAMLADLVRVDGVLMRRDATNIVFEGVVLDRFGEGGLKSRSEVRAGRIHGLSVGWHTNGVVQVEEWFTNGVAHGSVTRWHPNGSVLSQGNAVAGKLHGSFRRLHPDGLVAEEYQMSNGVPVGVARSWHPDGSLKAEVTFEEGKPAQSLFHAVGLVPGPAPTVGVGGGKTR